ncbi:MAG: DUF5671 domain-containing protein [Patescibacteria group bacterium]
MSSSLDNYITAAKEKNLSDEQIKNALRLAGWPDSQINEAFTPSNTMLMPAPPAPHVGMWTGFLYIIFFISLYILASSIGVVFHHWVDQILPLPKDPYEYFSYYPDSVLQGAVAATLVTLPIFSYLAFLLKKQLIKKPFVKNLRSRKILIYITLISTFLIMLGHVIGTIYDFLQGSANSINAIAHLGVTLLIAGSIFGYFISEVRYDSNT